MILLALLGSPPPKPPKPPKPRIMHYKDARTALAQTSKLRDANPLDQSDGFKAFLLACRLGDLPKCQECISQGVNINGRDDFDYTPLIIVSGAFSVRACVRVSVYFSSLSLTHTRTQERLPTRHTTHESQVTPFKQETQGPHAQSTDTIHVAPRPVYAVIMSLFNCCWIPVLLPLLSFTHPHTPSHTLTHSLFFSHLIVIQDMDKINPSKASETTREKAQKKEQRKANQ